MVRTRADASAVKISASKAPRKALGNSSARGSSSFSSPKSLGSKDRYSGGNSYNPQPTPSWQKEINSFFTGKNNNIGNVNDMSSKKDKIENVQEVASSNSSEGSSKQVSTSSDFTNNGLVSDDDDE